MIFDHDPARCPHGLLLHLVCELCKKEEHPHVPLADSDARNEPKGYNEDKKPFDSWRYD